jgi:hypothetical protein
MILFLFCILSVSLGLFAGVVWLALAGVDALLTSLERSTKGFADGHLLTGVLYLIPAGMFACVIGYGAYLAVSFFTAVMHP